MDSFCCWHAGARVDVDYFSDGMRMDEVAGNDQIICVPLRVDALLIAALHVVTASIANGLAGRMTMRLTMSSGSSGRSETCSSSNSLGMCRETSFMVNLRSKTGYGSVQLIHKQIRCNVIVFVLKMTDMGQADIKRQRDSRFLSR